MTTDIVTIVDIDAIDIDGAKADAARLDVALTVETLDGPNGLPVVSVRGERAAVQQLFAEWGYDDDAFDDLAIETERGAQ